MQDYKIKLDSFEGPMDLLVFLIKKNKVDIYDIPIAEITEQYLAYLRHFQKLNIEVASEFLVLASTLLLIKSRMMLPKEPIAGKTEEDDGDPRRELVERIIEYQRFKEISRKLNDLAEKEKYFISREPTLVPVKRKPPTNISCSDLLKAFRIVMEVREELAIPAVIVAHEEYSVETQMTRILTVLTDSSGKVGLQEVLISQTCNELIMTFLAMLELIRCKTIQVTQIGLYGGIYMLLRFNDVRKGSVGI